MFRRIAALLLRPFWRWIVRIIPDGDPWERIHVAPQLILYGSGARRDFPEYLTGSSVVAVSSINDIQEWLLGCQYERDEVLFAEPDHWQHPVTFERLRAGDCEDFALWAWRKLVELGIDADVIAGYCITNGKLAGRHAWVVYRDDGEEFLFEAVCRTKGAMIQPLGCSLERVSKLSDLRIAVAGKNSRPDRQSPGAKLDLSALHPSLRRALSWGVKRHPRCHLPEGVMTDSAIVLILC